MDLLLHSIQLDWPVLLPIFLCSIATVAVAIDRIAFYKANKRNVIEFIPRLQKELGKNNMLGAQNLAVQCGGIIGEVTEEAVRIFSEQKKGFSRSFDIASALATRKLERHLTILGIMLMQPFLLLQTQTSLQALAQSLMVQQRASLRTTSQARLLSLVTTFTLAASSSIPSVGVM